MSNSPHKKFQYVHIDCDPLVYKMGFAVQKSLYHIDGMTFETPGKAEKYAEECGFEGAIVVEVDAQPLKNATFQIDRFIRKITNRFKPHSTKLYLSPRKCFRDELTDTYKANRGCKKPHLYETPPPKHPFHYEAIRKYILNKPNAILIEGLEADDTVSINHFHLWAKNKKGKHCRKSVIVAEDKDFNNVPGWKYNPYKDLTFYTSYPDAVRHFYYQLLRGDSADNIKGIPRIQTKKIWEILGDTWAEGALYERVRNHYLEWGESKGVPAEDMMKKFELNCQLLWILWEPNCFWSPPTGEKLSYTNKLTLEDIQGIDDDPDEDLYTGTVKGLDNV